MATHQRPYEVDTHEYLNHQPQGQQHYQPVVLSRSALDEVQDVAGQVDVPQNAAHLLPCWLEPAGLALQVGQHAASHLSGFPRNSSSHHQPRLLVQPIVLSILSQFPPLPLAELLLPPRLLTLNFLLQLLEVLLQRIYGAYLAAHIIALILQQLATAPLPLQLFFVLPHDLPQLRNHPLKLLPQSMHGHPHCVLLAEQSVQFIELEVVGSAFELYFRELLLDLSLGAHGRDYEYNLCENNEYHSPGSDAEQQVGQLRDVLGICAVAVEEMTLFDEVSQLASACAVVVPGAQLYQFVADGRTGHHDDRDLVFHADSDLVNDVECGISDQDAHDLATGNTLGSLLSLSDAETEVDFELHFSSPAQVFVRIVLIVKRVLTRKRWVCPLASSVPSTCEGLILGNLISPSGAMPISLTPLLSVNFSKPEARPLSTITASVLKAALAIPAQNLPLPFSIAPMMLMTGVISVYLNLSSISRIGRFFLQTLLTLMSLASLPPGKRKSQGFQRSSFAIVLLTLTIEFLSRYSGRSSSRLAGLGLAISYFDSNFSSNASKAATTSSLTCLTGLFSSSLIIETDFIIQQS